MRESSTLTANAVPQAKGWVRYSSVSGSSSSSFIMHTVIKPFIVYNVHRLNILNCTYWYRCKNQFQNPSGVWQFCGYQYFSFEILFNLIYSYSPFFRISLIKIYTNVKTPKRKLGSFVQRYSFKFRALDHHYNPLQCTRSNPLQFTLIKPFIVYID